jgi:hypothetical protein
MVSGDRNERSASQPLRQTPSKLFVLEPPRLIAGFVGTSSGPVREEIPRVYPHVEISIPKVLEELVVIPV